MNQHQPIDRRDGNTKGEVGITSTGCLFCKDQISASSEFVKRFDEVRWADKDQCQAATCRNFNECPHRAGFRWCPIYQKYEATGRTR